MKLTKKALDDLKPPAKGRAFHFDESKPGFGVVVFSSGTITFIYQYWINGKKRRLTIGKYGKLTIKNAVDKAAVYAGQISQGIDPYLEKQKAAVAGITLRQSLSEYLENRALKETTKHDIQYAFEKGLSDWLDRPIKDLTRDMVATRHKLLGKKSQARANLTMRYLRAVLNYASEANANEDGQGLLLSNPVARLSKAGEWFKVKRRTRYLAEHEIKTWLNSVLSLPEKTKRGDDARDFFIILLFTGLRRSEALNLAWEHIDLTGRTLTIPDPKNDEPLTLPLSDYLFDLFIERAKHRTGNMVFKQNKNAYTFGHAAKILSQESGLELGPHDLRRTFATAAESLNISSYAVKTLLNHKQSGDVTRGYIQITPDRLRAPMQQITDYFLMKAGIKGPRVVKMPGFEAAGANT